MRILLAHNFYRTPGGEDRYVRDLVPLLRQRHDVALFERSSSEVPRRLSTAATMVYSRSVRSDLQAVLHGFRPDLIHLHNPYPLLGPSIHLAAADAGIPLVMTVHNLRLRCPNGVMFTEGEICRRCETGNYSHAFVHRCFPTRSQGIVYGTSLWLHRFVLKTDDLVRLYIAPSGFMSRRLRDWGFPASRTVTVPLFAPDRPRPSGEPGDYGLFAGRLSPEKGLDLLLDALVALNDPPFTIAGRGHLEHELRRRAQRGGLRNLRFVGWLDPPALTEVVSNSRFVAVPSVSEENFPRVALEAMLAAKPLVVSDTGGLAELVEGRRGLKFAPGSARELAARMAFLYADASACTALGRDAREFAVDEFSAGRHLQRLEEVYEYVRAGTHPPGETGGAEAGDAG